VQQSVVSEHSFESTSRFVKTSKWRLHYNEAGDGHPVIFLHGIGPGATAWSNFKQNIAGLAEHCRVILLDFPGWGKSDPVEVKGQTRWNLNREAVELLLDELGIEKAALVGNSMGGIAALEFAAHHPERVSHAVTMGGGLFSLPNIFSPGGFSEGLRIIFETYQDPKPENFRRLIEIMVFDKSFISDELVQLRTAEALADRTHLENFMRSPLGDMPHGHYTGVGELMNMLADLQTPVMMFHGRDDRTVPLETTLKTAAILQDARVVIINRCGHWLQVEHSEEFNRTLLNFLGVSPSC